MNKYIVIEHSVCKVFEVSRHDRCYKCLTSGHKVKSYNNTAVCSRCAGAHRSSNCDSDTKKCIFCVRKGLAEYNHYFCDCILWFLEHFIQRSSCFCCCAKDQLVPSIYNACIILFIL